MFSNDFNWLFRAVLLGIWLALVRIFEQTLITSKVSFVLNFMHFVVNHLENSLRVIVRWPMELYQWVGSLAIKGILIEWWVKCTVHSIQMNFNWFFRTISDLKGGFICKQTTTTKNRSQKVEKASKKSFWLQNVTRRNRSKVDSINFAAVSRAFWATH